MKQHHIEEYLKQALELISNTQTLIQIGIVLSIFIVSYLLASKIPINSHLIHLSNRPLNASLQKLISKIKTLLFPLMAIILLKLSENVLSHTLVDNWIFNTGIAVAAIIILASFIKLFVINPVVAIVFRWIGMPIVFLLSIGYFDDAVTFLDSMAVVIGHTRLSLYGFVRTLVIGSFLFWLGRISNTTGKTIIRSQESIDTKTREVIAKIFSISLYVVFIIIILQLMGINLTTLAIFSGAIGVGLGFGLQSIASNFISGIIILFDRSVSVGDFIELEDGRSGQVTELSMRCTTLETYDGKDIVVPNEKFITSSFTNWTHKDKKQRYRVDFSVSYKTDIRDLVEKIKAAVATHPQVLSGENLPIEERPDCEIDSFGDSGINMFVEFWMVGIDDGKNRVGGDLLLIILETLQENDIEIPFPQRDIHIKKTDLQ